MAAKVRWASILKALRETRTHQLAVYELARVLRVEQNSKELDEMLEHLRTKHLVRIATGQSSTGIMCRVVYLADDSSRASGPRHEEPQKR